MHRLFISPLLALVAASAAWGADETIVVTPTAPHGWGFGTEHGGGYSAGLVEGPAPTPAGTGSANLQLAGSSSSAFVGTFLYGGTKFSDLTTLKYSAYGNLTPAAIALQFDVDSDLTDSETGYQGRMVFEPYLTPGTVVPNTWTEWDALAGKWWGSPGGGTRPFTVACPQSNPCTTAYVLTTFPNIGVRVGGVLMFKAGSGWTAFNGNVDKFTIGTAEGSTTWDFELYSTPTDPKQCFDGGYTSFNPPGGPYRNQGLCVAAAVSKSDKH